MAILAFFLERLNHEKGKAEEISREWHYTLQKLDEKERETDSLLQLLDAVVAEEKSEVKIKKIKEKHEETLHHISNEPVDSTLRSISRWIS